MKKIIFRIASVFFTTWALAITLLSELHPTSKMYHQGYLFGNIITITLLVVSAFLAGRESAKHHDVHSQTDSDLTIHRTG